MANRISNNNNPNSSNGGGMARVDLMSNSSSASNISAAAVVGLVNTSTGQNMVGVVNDGITSLREITNYLMPVSNTMPCPPGVCPYDHIIDMLRGLDLQDDGITMNHKIKSIETDFCNIVRDEHMLRESMEYINDKALEDGETALKFALLFASRNFDALAMKETKVRTEMLTLLQNNFINSEAYRLHNRERLYNSITLLGEYYHRVRLADNSPITILGESLLGLLVREVNEEKNVNDVKLAKLILSQITLNGDLMRNRHKTEISQLLYHIRKNLIEQPSLKPTVKAIMLMTLDLFYSNFASLGSQLEVMYTKYFIMEDDDEGNNNQNAKQPTTAQTQQQQQQQSQPQQHQQQQLTEQQTNPPYNSSPKHQQQQQYNTRPTTQQSSYDEVPLPSSSNNTSYENGDSGHVNDNTEEDPDCNKKWSEQVCEDSFEEFNGVESELNTSSGGGTQDQLNSSYGDDRDNQHSSNSRYESDPDRHNLNSRRSYQPRQSPRPLKQNFNSNEPQQNSHDSQNSNNEERDESKELPRWRAPRFNRDDQLKGIRSRNPQQRFSASFDDDHQSVRSDNGSMRLYSISDRLKHAQEKIERSGNQTTYTGIANSNWDRQSQRDDRSERSYMSNYERGNNHNRRGGGSGGSGGRQYNNRPMYDKPPRFQKHKNMGAQAGGPGNYQEKSSADTWRRSNSNLQDENSSINTNGPESNSRSSSRARTLPRPAKSRIDGNHQNNAYRRSQSPNSYQQQRGGGGGGGGNHQHHARGNHHNPHHNPHQNKNRSHKFAGRYSSQSSLASEASSTLDQRHHQRNRSFSRRTSSTQQPDQQLEQQQQQQQQQPSNDSQHWNDNDNNKSHKSWNDKDTNSEL